MKTFKDRAVRTFNLVPDFSEDAETALRQFISDLRSAQSTAESARETPTGRDVAGAIRARIDAMEARLDDHREAWRSLCGN